MAMLNNQRISSEAKLVLALKLTRLTHKVPMIAQCWPIPTPGPVADLTWAVSSGDSAKFIELV